MVENAKAVDNEAKDVSKDSAAKASARDSAGAALKSIMDNAEISLILDTYDDIFSDFDPRPYNERALSEDFLIEARKAARDKNTGIELHFLIPTPMQDKASEELIRQRAKNVKKT